MKPVKLIMSAFGYMRKNTEIDFERLGSQGLYLITGDTGAGKTTILTRSCLPCMERRAVMCAGRICFAANMRRTKCRPL